MRVKRVLLQMSCSLRNSLRFCGYSSPCPLQWISQYKVVFTFLLYNRLFLLFRYYWRMKLPANFFWWKLVQHQCGQFSFFPFFFPGSKRKISLSSYHSYTLVSDSANYQRSVLLVPRPFAYLFGERHSLLQMMVKFVKQTLFFFFFKLDKTNGKGKIV